MKPHKITISCLMAFAVANLAFSQIVKPTVKYFKMPVNITSDDYMYRTVILKIKKEHRAECSNEQINIAPLEQYLNQIGASGLTKKFPHALPPAQERNRRGERYADLSLIYEFQYSAALPIEKVINKIYSLGIVEYAEPHYISKLLYTPNDPQIGLQGHLGQISAYTGWDISKGDTNVVIGITDTGFDIDHPDLQDNVKYNYNDPINGIDDDGDGYTDNFRGWDLVGNDNNPQAVSSDHGVHVSGIASPSTDNGIGVAGPGFNCRLLPVKVGDNNIPYGYEGITYAADHGANIINCSWGGNFGGALGQDVIDYATINKNALVVAGAGNDGAENLFYPASYEYVISVAWINSNNAKNFSSNYGYSIDVCAPGTNIYSTLDNIISGAYYGTNSGTSMASPVAAGCAAMIKAQNPSLTALQVGEQLKVTCDDIYPVNVAYIDKLGNGKVNLFKALSGISSPSVVMTNRVITDGNDNAFVIGDTLRITGLFVNYLATSGNINVTLSTTSTYVNIIDATTNLGVIAGFGGTADNNADPFSVVILPTAPFNTKVDFTLLISDGTYSKKEFFSVTANVDYINIAINEVATTITSKGLIGYNLEGQLEGLGFTYKNSSTLLYDAGLMVGIPGKVSDMLRDPATSANNDFGSVVNVQRVVPDVLSEFDLEGTFNDDPAAANKIDVEVDHKAFAWTLPGHTKYVIVEYSIKNTGAGTLNGLYAGIFADWDIMDYSLNNAAVDNTRKLGYCWSNEPGGLYAGIQLLTISGAFVHYAIDNDGSNGSIDIYTSYNTAEKYTTLSTNRPSAGQRDVTDVVSSGPFSIIPGDSVVVAFALLGGDSLSGLQQSADSAAVMYNKFPCTPRTANRTSVAANCGASDGTATANPTNGFPPYVFQWDSAAGNQTTQTSTGLSAGSYTVTVTDAQGCSGNFIVSVEQEPATASISSTFSTCGMSDGTATVNPTNGIPPYTYQWDSVAGNQTTQTATGLSSGTYNVSVNSGQGCSGIFTILVADSGVGTTSVSVNQHVSCFGGNDGQATASITGGTSPYTYAWDNGDTTAATTSGLTAGDYTVQITDSASCIAFQTVTINQPPQLTGVVSIIITISASADSVYITPAGGVPPYSYQWRDSLGVPYPGEINPIIYNVPYGTYLVTVTDGNGCDSTFIVIVAPPSGLAALDAANSISVYPNPNRGVFTVEIHDLRFMPYDLKVYDVLGREIQKSKIKNQKSKIDLSFLNKGVYLLNVNNSSGEKHRVIIIQ